MVAVDNAVSAIPFTSSEIFLTSLTKVSAVDALSFAAFASVSALVEAFWASVASCLASSESVLDDSAICLDSLDSVNAFSTAVCT